MNPNANVQHRVKHFDLLLARELSFIKREHSQNLLTHQKLENSIRRANNQSSSNNHRPRKSVQFDNTFNGQTDSFDYNKPRTNSISINLNQKHCLSFSGNSGMSQNQSSTEQMDELSDDTSYLSLRRRRFCTKAQRLPPIVKATISNRPRRESKTNQWMESFQQLNIRKENVSEPFTILNEESSKPKLPELSPLQRQVRSFLETLPTYKGVQRGFDSFGPSSLYSNRAPVAIR
jgi:hypothetical protein